MVTWPSEIKNSSKIFKWKNKAAHRRQLAQTHDAVVHVTVHNGGASRSILPLFQSQHQKASKLTVLFPIWMQWQGDFLHSGCSVMWFYNRLLSCCSSLYCRTDSGNVSWCALKQTSRYKTSQSNSSSKDSKNMGLWSESLSQHCNRSNNGNFQCVLIPVSCEVDLIQRVFF